ncbi:MAG: inosine/xanthosine triphosphatase [Bacteroidia bacterium]
MKIIIASRNPVKIEAVSQAFLQVFVEKSLTFSGINVLSGVNDQPMSDEETLRGAENRVEAAKDAVPEADFWVGVEGGIEEIGHQMTAFAWVVVRGKAGTGKGKTATFFLPDAVADYIREGIELGEADDKVFGTNNSKQKNGAVGLLTRDLITRTSLYLPAVIMALIPFINPQLYHEGKAPETPAKH